MDENLNSMENEIVSDNMNVEVEVQSHSDGNNGNLSTGQIVGTGVALMAGTALFNCLFIDAYQFTKSQVIKGAKAVKKTVTTKIERSKMKKKIDKNIENEETSETAKTQN